MAASLPRRFIALLALVVAIVATALAAPGSPAWADPENEGGSKKLRTALEAAAKGVCCNAIAPGVVHTPLTEEVFADPAKVTAHAARTMTGRNGVPDDFAACVLFLAGSGSAAVTGQTLFVDGGYSAT